MCAAYAARYTSEGCITRNSMRKKGYYEYRNGIYPRRLWVHIGKDLNELIEAEFDGCDPPDKEYGGVTYDGAVRKSDDTYGILVSFKTTKDMSTKYCCHEASHACDAIEAAIGMEHGGEASAYLIGWIADGINKARLGMGDFVEINDMEK